MSQNNFSLTEGHFFISVNGNRLKQYANNTVYLADNTEFSLEVFNPTTSKVLAKIKINGNYISTSGLVLKPGQRVFLERYFDKAQKFKFETYSVDNTPETSSAIANNGTVEIEFFKEYVAPNPVYIPPYTPYFYTNYDSTFSMSNCNGTITNTSNVYGSTNVNATSSSFSNVDKYEKTLSDVSMDFLSMEFERNIVSISEKKETGRVEAGSHSNQSFVLDYATYSPFSSSKVMWKILPLSQKQIQASEIKNYCSECGYRIRKSNFKFCPQCGNNLK